MSFDEPSFETKTTVINKKWIATGATLGVISGIASVVEGASLPRFPQLGVLENVLHVIALGTLGVIVTRQCKPTRRALIGAVITPILLIGCLLLIDGPNAITLRYVLYGVSSGALAGILLGTAWLGALIGIVVAFVFVVVSYIAWGILGWEYMFILLGAIVGAISQLVVRELVANWPFRTERKDPEWLRQKTLEKDDKAGDQ